MEKAKRLGWVTILTIGQIVESKLSVVCESDYFCIDDFGVVCTADYIEYLFSMHECVLPNPRVFCDQEGVCSDVVSDVECFKDEVFLNLD